MGDKDWRENEKHDKLERRYARALFQIERMTSQHYTGEIELEGVRMKLGLDGKIETLVVYTGVDSEGKPVVGFHSGFHAGEALAAGLKRIENGQMKWREDEYRQRRGTGADQEDG